MPDRDNFDAVRLDEAAARRLMERATELDARLASESTVAELRDAARAAGISEEAFNRALTEVRNPAPAVAPVAHAPRSLKRFTVVLFVALAIGVALAVSRMTIRPSVPERAAEPPGGAPPTAAPAPAPSAAPVSPPPTQKAPARQQRPR